MFFPEQLACKFSKEEATVRKSTDGITLLLKKKKKKLVHTYPASRASLCLLDQGVEKKTLSESRQDFEVTATRTSGLVDLVFSRQTSFPSPSILNKDLGRLMQSLR